MNRKALVFILLEMICVDAFTQNFSFNFNTSGQRVCLASAEVDTLNRRVKLLFLDSQSNNSHPVFVYKRLSGTYSWTLAASNLPPGTGHWVDNNVGTQDIWEYQVKRLNTWNYQGANYDAVGYTMGSVLADNTRYKGQMILLAASDVSNVLAIKYQKLKKEITADGWLVNELMVPRATAWNSGNEVVNIKNQIISIYNSAPAGDKPKILFILGHVPLPRSGATSVTAPDEHDENKGARGADAYYADINGSYTDNATFNPGGLATPLAINTPGDFKWDQDFFPSDIEMAFGRVDFADITDYNIPELQLMERYLDRLSNYKNKTAGFDMGQKTAFYFGYDNSNDGSYRSLLNISKPSQVIQNYAGPNHNQWVQNNGPFAMYMQNLLVPDVADWNNFGMNATVFSSDQSYWGFGDVPQTGIYSRIRALLAADTKCLVTLWTTTGINIFHKACTGMPLSLAMKDIMNHNTSNQLLQKPPQDYDTPDWWNRTHFAFYGDPTLNLYQVAPPSNAQVSLVGGNAVLQWTASPDTGIKGYHVYESNSELGVFNRITTQLVTTLSHPLPNYQPGKWYMVKAVKIVETGCGYFYHGSLGYSVQGNVVVGVRGVDQLMPVRIFPNPVTARLIIQSPAFIQSVEIINATGSTVFQNEYRFIKEVRIDMEQWPAGTYYIIVRDPAGKSNRRAIVKPPL
jgi:hypothetical protein